MKNIIQFIRDFHSNSGSWILSATLLNKFILFVIKAFILVFLAKAVYGQVTIAMTIIMFFTPFIGFGSPSGLLRYGAIAESEEERHRLTDYAFSRGLIHSIFLMVLVLAMLPFLSNYKSAVFWFACLYAMRIISLFLNSHQSVQMRVEKKNRLYGQYEIVNSLILLCLAVGLSYAFGAIGYIVGLVLAPIVGFVAYSLWFGFPKWNLKWDFSFEKKEFWSYSLLSSFSAVVTQFVFFIDIYLIGMMMGDEPAAEYNAAGLIPINVLVLPLIVMRTDFVKLAENYKNRTFLKKYYLSYLALFFGLSVIGMLIAVFLGEWIFGFLGDDYQPYGLFLWLMGAVCISIMFRVPLANMIAAFGKAKFNTISGVITLVLALVLNLILIPKYGLYGAVWATCISLVVSSLLNLGYFIWYLKYECD